MTPNNKLDVKPLPDKLNCPVCEGEIDYVSDFQNPQPVKKGNVIVCGHCASILKVGDSNLVKMTKQEFNALDDRSRHLSGKALSDDPRTQRF